MAMTTTTATGLYREVRGSGPAVLLIPGATGDAGHFTRTAERLSDEFTVITYDRRGNSRSLLRGDPGTAATMSAQADDAAAVITDCGFEKAVVFGTSGGAEVTLELVVKHPIVIKGVAIHEPPLLALLPQEGPSPLQPIFDLAQTNPPAALELFLRANSSEAAWQALDPALRERMLGNAVTLFAHEIGHFISYQPSLDALKSAQVPVELLRSRDGLPFASAVEARLSEVFGVEGCVLSGHHAPYFDNHEVFAEELRPILRRLWS